MSIESTFKQKLFEEDLMRWVELVECPPYRFEIVRKGDSWFLLARYTEMDVDTGQPSVQTTRKWYLSPHMTKSEFVQTCLKCVLTSMEHRAREWFTYRGKRVFGPHYDVDALHDICDHTDVRPA